MPRIRPNAVSAVTNLLSPAVCATAWRRTTPDVSANTDACLRKSRREGFHEFMAIVHSCCWDAAHYTLARLEQVFRYFTPAVLRSPTSRWKWPTRSRDDHRAARLRKLNLL